MSLAQTFAKVKTNLYKNYGENPGKMLLHTGTIGWALSSLAQIGAIITNDKISNEQKAFLIPQEAGDGLINILSFYCLTSSVKALCSRMVLNGKLSNKAIKGFIDKNKLAPKIGKHDFNITKEKNFSEIKDEFISFKNGVDVLASTGGSILSCNYVTPILRNEIATNNQQKYNSYVLAQNPTPKPTPNYRQFTMKDFQNGLKI